MAKYSKKTTDILERHIQFHREHRVAEQGRRLVVYFVESAAKHQKQVEYRGNGQTRSDRTIPPRILISRIWSISVQTERTCVCYEQKIQVPRVYNSVNRQRAVKTNENGSGC